MEICMSQKALRMSFKKQEDQSKRNMLKNLKENPPILI